MSDTTKFLTEEERRLYRYLVARRLWELLVGWGLTTLAIVPGSWAGVAAAETYGDAGMTLAFAVIALLMWVGMTRIQKAEKTYRLYREITAAGESREAHRLLGRGPGPAPMPIPSEVGQRIERHYRRIGFAVALGVAAVAGGRSGSRGCSGKVTTGPWPRPRRPTRRSCAIMLPGTGRIRSGGPCWPIAPVRSGGCPPRSTVDRARRRIPARRTAEHRQRFGLRRISCKGWIDERD